MDKEINNILEVLSLAELAVLELTNDGSIDYAKHILEGKSEPVILTTKDTYIWGIIIASLLEKKTDIDIDDILNAYKSSLKEFSHEIKKYYEEFPYHGSRSWFPGMWLEEFLFSFMSHFSNEDIEFEEVIDMFRKSEKVYYKMIERGYIEDPIFTGIFGVGVAVLGLVPVGFSQKTSRGKVLSRKINALYWSYEMNNKNGVKSVTVQIKLLKVLKAFKKAMAEECEDLIELDNQKDK